MNLASMIYFSFKLNWRMFAQGIERHVWNPRRRRDWV